MIDLAVGVDAVVSNWWSAPGIHLSLGWRPVPAVELQGEGLMTMNEWGGASDAGVAISSHFWSGTLTRLRGHAGLTAGVHPVRVELGRWEASAGARVGAGLACSDEASFRPSDEPGTREHDSDVCALAWSVAAVAEMARPEWGLRLRLGRVTWVTEEYGLAYTEGFLLPGAEVFVRW